MQHKPRRPRTHQPRPKETNDKTPNIPAGQGKIHHRDHKAHMKRRAPTVGQQTRSRSCQQYRPKQSRTLSPPTKSTSSSHSKPASRHRKNSPPGSSSHHVSKRERTHSTSRSSPSREGLNIKPDPPALMVPITREIGKQPHQGRGQEDIIEHQ